MIVGVPKELEPQESRVSVTPHGASELKEAGHEVLVERDAGVGSGFSDDEYDAHGSEICGSTEEIYSRSEMIVKVKEPTDEEISLLRDGVIYSLLRSKHARGGPRHFHPRPEKFNSSLYPCCSKSRSCRRRKGKTGNIDCAQHLQKTDYTQGRGRGVQPGLPAA